MIDGPRATRSVFKSVAAHIHTMGHSLGATAALALATQAASPFISVIAQASADVMSTNATVNTTVTGSAFDRGPAQFQLRVANLPALLVHADNDGALGASVSHVFFHALAARANKVVSVLALAEDGTHVGTEDCLDVHVRGL